MPNNRQDRLLLQAHQEEEEQQQDEAELIQQQQQELIQNLTREHLPVQARELMVPTAPGEGVGGSWREPPALKGSHLPCAAGARRAREVMSSLSVRGMACVCNWWGSRMRRWEEEKATPPNCKRGNVKSSHYVKTSQMIVCARACACVCACVGGCIPLLGR